MKNENIKKINTIGKISKILAIITRITLLISATILIVIGICFLSVPSDAIQGYGTAQGQIILDGDRLPEDLVKIELGEDHIKLLGMKLATIVTETRNGSDRIIDISANAENVTGAAIKHNFAVFFFGHAVFLIFVSIIFIFAQKLAAALGKCESPFEENVLKALNKFTFSLIPLCVIMLFLGSGCIPIAFVILFVILICYCFKHGAELQKESDETL